MAPPNRRLSIVARVLAPVAVICTSLAMPARADAFVAWGTVLVPGWQWAGQTFAGLGDLNVYSNGDGNEDQSSSFGLSYECVELAQRFAAVRFGEQKIWPISYAYQMWTAGPQLTIPFVQHANGGSSAPQTGDLLIFDHVSGAPFGHVAVVEDTGPDYVDVVEQNWDNSNPVGSARLPINGTTMPARNGVPVIGWLRSSTAAAPFKPVVITTQGQVYGYAGATTYGGPASLALAKPVIGAAATPTAKGYWMVAGDGGVFSYGDAQFYGSTGNIKLNQPIVGMASTPSGKGYWLVASDGGVFAFGDAQFHGSTGNLKLNQPVVGVAAAPDGKGYWLVASDGGIFAFGDSGFHGSTGNIKLNKPINGMSATADGKGYWMVASDGGMFAFGDAPFYGSTGNITVPSAVTRMTATSDGGGYWLVTQGGTVYAFGNAKYLADNGVVPVNNPVVGLITTLTSQ